MLTVEINYLAVLVAAVVNMAIGAAWYSQALFGKIWMQQSGVTQQQITAAKKQMPLMYAASFVGALVMSFVLAHFVTLVGASTISAGIQTGFWAWLGFVATTSLAGILWEGKKPGLYLLNNSYNLVALILMGAILAVWV